MNLQRAGGVVLSVTSLPGPGGVGDLGAPAHRWIEWLHDSDCSLWQLLPIGPAGKGWSPYQAASSFAGSTLLISLPVMAREGWLRDEDSGSAVPAGPIDYPAVQRAKSAVLAEAVEGWRRRGRPERERFESWCGENRDWLDDFALFAALKEAQPKRTWTRWDSEIARREAGALDHARRRFAGAIESQRLQQYWFWAQWRALRSRARALGVRLLGDLPIYPAHESADVWANPHLFKLDRRGECAFVGGVPPDYFSATGQRWDTPTYDWDRHREEDYRWWTARVRHAVQTFDAVRLDHFRGFEAYWEIPASAPTAETGRWVIGPGAGLFEALRDSLGETALFAEDLGVITPEVDRLRDTFGLPGMHVLQLDLSGADPGADLRSKYHEQSVAYTGTHDNDTSRGWFESLPDETRRAVTAFLGAEEGDIVERMIQWVWSSPAAWAVTPLQDLLDLGTDARTNLPGTQEGNWRWRAPTDALTDDLAGRMASSNRQHGRSSRPGA